MRAWSISEEIGGEGAAQQPDGKGLGKRGVQQNQSQQAVGQVHIGHKAVDAHQKDRRGKHLAHDDGAHKDGLTLEAHPGQGVSGRDAAQDGQAERPRVQILKEKGRFFRPLSFCPAR